MLGTMLQSAGYAYRGMRMAFKEERNLKLFSGAYVGVLLFSFLLPLTQWEWLVLLILGGTFIATELMNTALEHFVDAFCEHCQKEHGTAHFEALRASKDIAASASLTMLIVTVVTLVVIVLPKVFLLFSSHFSALQLFS